MGDEQTILLGPEDELTSVRERLERTQARRIILVIPAQTQLRSHVGWRLINARMRELGKELLVISPERQIRAVAKAAGFQVAETQQDVPSRRPRLGGGTRPGVTNASRPSRSGSSRGEPESHAPQAPGERRRVPAHMSTRSATRSPSPKQLEYKEDEATLARLKNREAEASQRSKSVPPTFFTEPEQDIDPAYDFSNQTTPAGSLSDEDDGTEFKNTYEADYQTAQNILKAAKEGTAIQEHLSQQVQATPSRFEEVEEKVPEITDKSVDIMEGEIEDLGDFESIDLPEIHADQTPRSSGKQQQRLRPVSGSSQPQTRHSPRAPRPNPPGPDDDDELLAFPDQPTRDIVSQRPSRGLSRSQRPSQALPPDPDPRPSRRLGQVPRPSQALPPDPDQRPSRRLGQVPRPSQALPPDPDQRPSRRLGQVPRPSQALPPDPDPRPSRGLSQVPRPSQALDFSVDQRPARPASAVGANTRAPAGGQRPASRQSRPSLRPQAGGARRVSPRNHRGMAIFLVSIVLLLIIGVVVFYTVPAATVTISLYASPATQHIQLTASASPLAHVSNGVPAHILQQSFSVSGPGKATGSTQVGNAQAHGYVTFTNNGKANVTIPTNTLLTTPNGVQFTTGAEVVVSAGGTQPAVPVNAQQSGNSGNVAANTITVIPSASLSSIAQHSNLSPSSVTTNNLTVTNDAATNGGGAATVPAATQNDVKALAKTLHQKAQQEVQTWLTTQTHPGDVMGTPTPNVLGSPNPLTEEQVSVTPQVGQPVNNGAFSGTLTLHVSVLVARATDVQAAAGRVLNATALQAHPAKTLATQLPVTLTHVQSTASQDGNTLAITADASGELIPQLDPNAIAGSITNQGFSQATHDLKNGLGVPNLTGVKDVQISIFPSFLSILPIQAGRIRIILKPIQATPPPKISNGP